MEGSLKHCDFNYTLHRDFKVLTLLIYFQVDTASARHIPGILHALHTGLQGFQFATVLQTTRVPLLWQDNQAPLPSSFEVYYYTM